MSLNGIGRQLVAISDQLGDQKKLETNFFWSLNLETNFFWSLIAKLSVAIVGVSDQLRDQLKLVAKFILFDFIFYFIIIIGKTVNKNLK